MRLLMRENRRGFLGVTEKECSDVTTRQQPRLGKFCVGRKLKVAAFYEKPTRHMSRPFITVIWG